MRAPPVPHPVPQRRHSAVSARGAARAREKVPAVGARPGLSRRGRNVTLALKPRRAGLAATACVTRFAPACQRDASAAARVTRVATALTVDAARPWSGRCAPVSMRRLRRRTRRCCDGVAGRRSAHKERAITVFPVSSYGTSNPCPVPRASDPRAQPTRHPVAQRRRSSPNASASRTDACHNGSARHAGVSSMQPISRGVKRRTRWPVKPRPLLTTSVASPSRNTPRS